MKLKSTYLTALCPIVAISVTLCGCADTFYRERSHNAVKNAQAQLELTNADQDRIMTQMQANFESADALKASVFREIADDNVPIQVRAALRAKVSNLSAQLQAGPTGAPAPVLAEFNDTLDQVRREVMGQLKDAGEDVASGRLTAAAAEEQYKAAKKEYNRWSKKVAAFTKMIEVMPTTTALADAKDAQVAATKLKEVISAAGKEKIEYVDADGQTHKEETLGSVIGKEWAGSQKAAGDDIAGAVSNVASVKAPGAIVILAALAKDLADLRLSEAQARVRAWGDAKVVLDEAERIGKAAKGLAEMGAAALSRVPNQAEPEETLAVAFANESAQQMLLASIKATREAEDNDAAIQPGETVIKSYQAAQVYALIKGPYQAIADDLLRATRSTRHRVSISGSVAALREHRALISRSLAALELFEASKIRPEKVGEFVYRVSELSLFSIFTAKTL